MSRDSEKVLKELQKFLDAHAEDTENEADVDALAERFSAEYNLKCKEQKESAPETADDYLDLAEQVTSKKKRVEYLHKALELEPDNLDARLQLILRTAEQPDERRLALQELLDAADKQMEKSGAFKEYAGEFWTAFETRPYMRVRYTYFDVLISCGMMRRAIDEGQRLLELCENDNLGVRYQLMHLYAYMEDEMHALALHKQFDSYEETQMLLPLAVLYYKLNQFDKAEDYIKRLAKANKDTKKFLRAAAHDELDDYIDELNPYGYQPFTMEELLDAGFDPSYGIAFSNNCISEKNSGRCFTTFDMGIVDLYNGELTQYKQGAAPTYIIHSEGIEVLCGASLPIGVLPEAECDVIHQELEPEDRLVMVSDGAFGDEEDMREILENLDTEDCKETLEYIISQVLLRCEGRLEDDVTVIVAKLEIA